MTDEILRITDLRIAARTEEGEEKILVQGIDLTLHRGEVLGLIGESGAGKSTIGLAALAYARPGCTIIGGEIRYAGTDIRTLSRRERRRLRGRRIAYVAQSAAASFNPAKSLYRQVCEMPVRHGLMSYAEAKKAAAQLFAELDLPSPETFGERYPHQVSGGQLQRAMVAMAMSCRPDILVFDEPTTALDVTTQIEVLAAIRKLVRDHRTAGLYISHDLAVVAQVAQRIMVLRHGRMVELGEAAQILHEPREEYTRRLVSVRAAAAPPAEAAVAERGERLLELNALGAAYGRLRVLKDVTFSVRRGETVAVVGESGSGKSTLARVVCGLREPAGGSVRFRGELLPPTLSLRSRDQLRRIQMIYQMPDMALNPRQRVSEILGRPLSFYFGWPRAKVTARVEALLRMIDLPVEFAARRPGELSGGQKQRLCIARALAAEPDLVICDEVTSALDPLVAEEILKLLGRLRDETGVAYLFITHDLGTVRRIADRVAVMLQGAVVAEGPLAQVFSPPYHPYTEALLASVPEMRLDWLDDTLRRRAGRQGAEGPVIGAAAADRFALGT
ncbi:MAG TPA: ABC transporter ATP-binding protein [Stellaceae bacterium]|nr:ABC transporter ATP-binding protein [Stellaceae bacterium]